jgi:hypothetical protein
VVDLLDRKHRRVDDSSLARSMPERRIVGGEAAVPEAAYAHRGEFEEFLRVESRGAMPAHVRDLLTLAAMVPDGQSFLYTHTSKGQRRPTLPGEYWVVLVTSGSSWKLFSGRAAGGDEPGLAHAANEDAD